MRPVSVPDNTATFMCVSRPLDHYPDPDDLPPHGFGRFAGIDFTWQINPETGIREDTSWGAAFDVREF